MLPCQQLGVFHAEQEALHPQGLFVCMKILSLRKHFSARDLRGCCRMAFEMIGAKIASPRVSRPL